MSSPALQYILDREFRSNPAYELVELERLSQAERMALQGLLEDTDSFGVLRPRTGCGLAMKAVCKDTALLFYSMSSPGRLPAFVARIADEAVNRQIVGLVLDGILQIGNDDGFVSGADAHPATHENGQPTENLARIARISRDAVLFGQRLRYDDPLKLSAQLYFFNRMPVTPRWQRQLCDDSQVSRFVGTGSEKLARTLRTEWKELSPTPETHGWRRWSSRSVTLRGTGNPYSYKIYISPVLAAIPQVLPLIIDAFTEKGVRHFKMGADLPGLTRADKIVAYLDSFQEVDALGSVLGERLGGDIPVQGVPFTADLCHNGLVSWGMDPHERPLVQGRENQSWRLWITNRLASALIHAGDAADTQIEPWQFALDRLRLDGIDTDSWTPQSGYREYVRQQQTRT